MNNNIDIANESLQDAAKSFANKKWENYCDVETATEEQKLDAFTDKLIGIETSKYDFTEGATWQKEKDKAIIDNAISLIKELLADNITLVAMEGYMKKTELISKAENFIKSLK